jgi:hypothetical protein
MLLAIDVIAGRVDDLAATGEMPHSARRGFGPKIPEEIKTKRGGLDP